MPSCARRPSKMASYKVRCGPIFLSLSSMAMFFVLAISICGSESAKVSLDTYTLQAPAMGSGDDIKALNDKIAQYDTDMSAKTETLNELNATLEAENAEYAQLREHFDKVDADKRLAAEEDDRLEMVLRRRAFGNAIVNRICIKIQAAFRGHQGRVIVAKMKPKGKGKKGKK